MTRDLAFRDPNHHGGENMTLRRGVKASLEWKWRDLFAAQHPITDDPDTQYYFGEVTRVTVKRFCDLSDDDLQKHHMSVMGQKRDLHDLLAVMKEMYSDPFEPTEICTLIFYEVRQEGAGQC